VAHLRPGYAEEAWRLVEHLATIGIRRIGIAYQETTFGTEVSRAAWRAAKARGITPVALTSVAESGTDAAAAAQQLAARQPETVLVGLSGRSTVEFVRACRAQMPGLSLYALSVMGSAATLRELGAEAVGITISQVVPAPANPSVPVVRRFLQDWAASGTKLEPSHIALEGYLSALAVGEVLRRTRARLSRQAFLDVLWTPRPIDLGGFHLSFERPGRSASRFLELTMVGAAGRFLR
jgi:ABC-type branched-subunit amino acid transport system substrate-binding protein